MKRRKSEQSRVLRRRVITHAALSWIAYTAVFVILALIFNATLVPKIGDWVADNTSQWVYYDPAEYLKRYSFEELLEQTLREYDEQGIPYSVVSVRDYWPDEEGYSDSGESSIDSTNSENGYEASDASSNNASSNYSLVDNVIDETAGKVVPTAVRQKSAEIIFNDENGEPTTEIFDENMLAWQAANRDYENMRSSSPLDYESWGEPYGPFQARNLSVYNQIKGFKWPTVAIIYAIGFVVLVFLELGWSMRYFDELSNAVVSVITDREKPVKLSRGLQISQSELNELRLQSLADEKAAAAAEQRKNELVAYLAHDIRTPLTSVIGYLSLLDEAPELPEESKRRFIHTAFIKSERLESLIDEFFEITRYNMQTIPIERSHVNVRLFLEQVADEFYPQASEKSVKITVSAPGSETFFIDADKLARALGNIVRNAVSYADSGTTVKICAEKSEQTDGEKPRGKHENRTGNQGSKGWFISVSDQGREIAPEHLKSIFEKFYREDGARNADSGGAGLGLAIAKEIITAHGGNIFAESKNGETRFTVTLY